VLIVLQKTGENIGWGFQLQNPVVVLLLSYILFVVGLNLSGMFEFTGRLANIGQDLTQKKGYTGSFFTGALATIVATPCTAPFMGIALGYALLQPPVVSMAIFLALGFGLALPYLLLCVIPALRKALPRPGAWMETFRQFLAFPMFASAAWLLWVYGQQVEGYYTGLMALLGAVFIAMGIWMWKRAPAHQPARSFIHFIAALFIIIAVSIASISMAKIPMTVAKIENSIEEAAIRHDTIPFSPATFDELIAGKDPVFVEMTASWCITCKVNERIALKTESTKKLFEDHNVSYVQGDWTNQNPEITNFLKSHGRNGVPLYVFYGERDPTTNTRPEPVVLPQLLTNGLVADIVINQ
ncbi:MAG: disulfide bond formation protein DsbD, partial [Micavibrio aeruginosavorus]